MTAKAVEFARLSESICHWSVYEPAVKCEVGCTAIRTRSGWTVIDPVPLAQEAWDELLGEAPLRAILLTNGNHLRDTLGLRARHQVPIVAAVATRKDIPDVKPDVTLLPNEVLYGITALAIPGATPGETAFHLPTERLLVLGDAIINVSPENGLEFLPDKYCSDARQSRESLRALLACDFDLLTLAHGAPVVTRAKEKFNALLNSAS